MPTKLRARKCVEKLDKTKVIRHNICIAKMKYVKEDEIHLCIIPNLKMSIMEE